MENLKKLILNFSKNSGDGVGGKIVIESWPIESEVNPWDSLFRNMVLCLLLLKVAVYNEKIGHDLTHIRPFHYTAEL